MLTNAIFSMAFSAETAATKTRKITCKNITLLIIHGNLLYKESTRHTKDEMISVYDCNCGLRTECRRASESRRSFITRNFISLRSVSESRPDWFECILEFHLDFISDAMTAAKIYKVDCKFIRCKISREHSIIGR